MDGHFYISMESLAPSFDQSTVQRLSHSFFKEIQSARLRSIMFTFVTLCIGLVGLTGVFAAPAPLEARQVASWPNPEPCTGNCTFVHDPSVIQRADGVWYRLSTNGDIAVASAPSLNGPWTYHGPMLPGGSSINVLAGQEIWAPDVSFVDGAYWAYYSVSAMGSQASQIGLASSTSLDSGTWTDHGSIDVPKASQYNLIDPNFFQESATDPVYLSFGSSWKGIFQTEMVTNNLQQPATTAPPANIVFNSTAAAHGSPTDPAIVEGSYQFWWTAQGVKYYYLFFSSGACCQAAVTLAAPGDEYKIMVGRSTAPTGPFVDEAGRDVLTGSGGSLVLGSHGAHVYAPGGQGVLLHREMKVPVMYYHYVDPTIGYDYSQFQFGFNCLDFDSGWPAVVACPAA